MTFIEEQWVKPGDTMVPWGLVELWKDTIPWQKLIDALTAKHHRVIKPNEVLAGDDSHSELVKKEWWSATDIQGGRVTYLFQPATNDDPVYHALIIGVSRYTHLVGGTGPLTDEPLAASLEQLAAAATSAARVAIWIRDHFEHPTAGKGSIRLLVSPSDAEMPLPEEIEAPPATYENVKRGHR